MITGPPSKIYEVRDILARPVSEAVEPTGGHEGGNTSLQGPMIL